MLPSGLDLTYFVEIARLGNLTRAADRIGISQPSLSLALQRLESSVGTILFIRTRQGVKLTKAGERLLTETRKLMDDWESLRQQTLNTMNEVRGRITIGCHASVANYSLPLFLPHLLQKHPDIEIGLHHDLSRTITQKVLSLELDLAIVVNPSVHPDLVMKPLVKDVVTLWRARKTRNEDVLICEPSLIQTQVLMNKLKRQGFKFKRVIESSNLEVIAGLVDCGTGVGVLPERVARACSPNLVRMANAPTFQDEILLVYRVENKPVRAIQTLSQAIQEGFAASRL